MALEKIARHKDNFITSIRRTFDEHPVLKFVSIVVLLVCYFFFAVHSHGVKVGLMVSILTWSFFVLCTPIADAGILIDFPFRLISGIKMIYSEIAVWLIAIGINLFMLLSDPGLYDKTILLSLFKHILDTPFPYWSIILISGIGTFLSIYIADELTDPHGQKVQENFLMRYKVVIFIFLIVFVIVLYDFLLNKLGVQVPLL